MLRSFIQKLLDVSCFGVENVTTPLNEPLCASNRQVLSLSGNGFTHSNEFGNFNCKFAPACVQGAYGCPTVESYCFDSAGVDCQQLRDGVEVQP